jgi:hypothetical protein
MNTSRVMTMIEEASGIKPLALLTPSGKKVKELSEVFSPAPLPNYHGLFLATSGVYTWGIYKDKEWRIRILGPDAKG